ncbi:3-phenylpropionate MFS transporter [Motilimonas sp. E26]|uniref:3-phenylpropionate MFS transporter n=1 Tax=Motilimonas sp. E26 TaxID=2865674 RepID=UPI001E510A6F|nr:3-phenylpropionate MFS transporter [Motilimonas sp. E26]
MPFLSSPLWLASFFSLFFFAWGIFLPFWALWLEGEGLTAGQIGLVLGTGLFLRCIASLLIVPRVKKESQLLPVIRYLCFLTLACFAVFLFLQGFVLLALGTLLANFIISPLMPLGDALASKWVSQIRLDYGKVRLWGSVSFIVSSSIMGGLITRFDHNIILYAMLASLLALVLMSLIKPATLPKDTQVQNTVRTPLWQVLKKPSVIRFIIITSCIQGSHAAYYSFSSIYWKSVGYSETSIGYLWGFSVLAEVCFMAFASKWFGQWRASQLFLLAAVGVAVRWSLLASTTEISVIVLAQAMHAITFAAAQIAAIRYISEEASAEYAIQLQALYAAIALGLTTAVLTLMSGYFYPTWQANIFWLMAVLALPVFYLARQRQI